MFCSSACKIYEYDYMNTCSFALVTELHMQKYLTCSVTTPMEKCETKVSSSSKTTVIPHMTYQQSFCRYINAPNIRIDRITKVLFLAMSYYFETFPPAAESTVGSEMMPRPLSTANDNSWSAATSAQVDCRAVEVCVIRCTNMRCWPPNTLKVVAVVCSS